MRLQSCSLLAVLLLVIPLCEATHFDFFYHVQQWPGSFCDTKQGCCFPADETPAADFGIHGLWPNYAHCPRTGRCWPDSCNRTDHLDENLIKDLEGELRRNWGTLACKKPKPKTGMAFWAHEWSRHGTFSNMGQRAYFLAALDFKARFNLTRILLDAGDRAVEREALPPEPLPGGREEGDGVGAKLECNQNRWNEAQLYQVHQCVALDGETLVHCNGAADDEGCPGDSDMVKLPPLQLPRLWGTE
ncbi:hypothetical protein ACP4OV_028240 [Aristida adscensionis]